MATGTQVTYTVEIDVDADGTAGIDYTLIHPGTIADCHFVTTVGGAASVSLQRQAQGAGAFNGVSSALSASSSGDLSRTTGITAAQSVCAAGDVLRALVGGAGAAQRGILYVTIIQAPQQ